MDEPYYVYYVKTDQSKRRVKKTAFDSLTDAEKYFHKIMQTETDLLFISLSWADSILKYRQFFRG